MQTPTRLIAALLTLAFSTTALHAQNTQLQRFEAQADQLRQQVATEQTKVDLITADMERVDGHMEATVDRIVNYLKSTSDSADSRSTVTQQKREAIDALKRSVAHYEKERQSRFRQLESGYSHLPESELAKDIDFLEERASKRMDQIVALAQSFSQHKDYRRSYRYYDTARVTGDSRKRQAANQGQREKEALNSELGEIIRKLKEENRTLQRRLNAAPADKQSVLREQVTSNDERIKILQEKSYAIAAQPKPARSTVGGRAARANRDLIVEAMDEIDKNAAQLQTLKRKRDQQRTGLKAYLNRLDEAEKTIARMRTRTNAASAN
jgi:chromosome segregation ATPase